MQQEEQANQKLEALGYAKDSNIKTHPSGFI